MHSDKKTGAEKCRSNNRSNAAPTIQQRYISGYKPFQVCFLRFLQVVRLRTVEGRGRLFYLTAFTSFDKRTFTLLIRRLKHPGLCDSEMNAI